MLSDGFCSGRRGVYVVSGIGIKRKFLGRGYPKEEVTWGRVGSRKLSGALPFICIQNLKSLASTVLEIRD